MFTDEFMKSMEQTKEFDEEYEKSGYSE